jgi:capsular exopolysaccharide synthesis family protein
MDRITKAIELASQKMAEGQQLDSAAADLRETIFSDVLHYDISRQYLKEQKVIAGFLEDPVADSYRLLRTRILQRMRQNNWTTLGVTSPNPGAGKSLTALNLSIAIALEPNYSALLVDADLRRPTIHRFLGIKPEHGLGEYLSSDISIDQLLLNFGIEDLAVLPCPEHLSGSSELLTTPKMVSFVDELKARYPSQVMVFDLPPVLVGDDVVAFSSHLDAVLVVVEDGVTQAPELARTVELLEGTSVIGCILNKSEDADQSYQYHY